MLSGITSSIKLFQLYRSENQFVEDIGRRMFIKIKEIGPEVLTNLIYAISDEADFELMIVISFLSSWHLKTDLGRRE